MPKNPFVQHKIERKKKICIHAPLHLGDSVISLPFLQNLRFHYPQIKITLIARKELTALWRYQPYTKEIRTCDSSVNELSKLSRWLKGNCFDLSFLLATGEDVAQAHWEIGIPARIGYDFWWRGHFFTHYIPTTGSPTDPKLTRKHMVHNYLDLLDKISIKPKFYRPRLFRTKKKEPF